MDKLEASEASSGLAVPVWVAVGTATVAGTALPVVLHLREHGVVNVHHVALSFFFWLNAIIAYWELCLFFHRDLVRAQYEGFREQFNGRELDRVIAFFGSPIPLSGILSMRRWAEVWSSYSLFDDGYSDKKSYGFTIDIGNGFSTLLPSLAIPYLITFPLIPSRALGIVALIFSYQMLYGTILYFTSFIINRRYEGHTFGSLAVFVGLSNGIWTVFPLWAIALSLWMIYQDSFAIFVG